MPGAKKPLHVEAQQYDQHDPLKDLLLPNVAQTLGAPARRTTRRTPRVPLLASTRINSIGRPLDWAPWLGKPLGGGGYGTAFRLKYDSRVAGVLERAKQTAAFVIEHRRPPPGGSIIIKVAADFGESGEKPFNPREQVDAFAQESVMEGSWHRFLDNGPCVRLPGLSKGVCPTDTVPDLYWGGMVADALEGRRFYITVMGVAPGMTMHDLLRRQPLTAALYVAVERAVAMMWLHGVTHTDFHWENVLVDPATDRATVIDFGQGVGLSGVMVAHVRATLPRAVQAGVRSLGELWRDPAQTKFGLGIKQYTNRVRAGRYGVRRGQATFYNPDGNSLMQLYRRLSAQQRALVPSARRRLWGAPEPRSEPRSESRRQSPQQRQSVRSTASKNKRSASKLGPRKSLQKTRISKRALLQQAAKAALPAAAGGTSRFKAARLAAANKQGRMARFRAALATRLPSPPPTASEQARMARFRAALATRLPSPSPMQISPTTVFASPMSWRPS